MKGYWAYLLVAGVGLGAGCSAPRPPLVVSDPDPSVKIPAIKKAVREKDKEAARQMVLDLESDDPAVRFFAIQGLQRLCGNDLGYRYWETEQNRQAAVERWKQWLDGEGADAKADTK
jgi:hypothetical protein